jgi:uncharacterized protein YdaU (DUF1376 family)
MLDWYYLNEKALPVDTTKVARLIRMPKLMDVVEAVLAEFFVLSDDGYHNKRADDELTAMRAKQEQQATKDEHEAERLRRHRERRAEIFAALRAAGVVPAWDVPMKELQRLFDESCNAPETRTGALPETDPLRLSLPTPTPTPIEEKVVEPRRSAAPPTPPPDFDGRNSEILNGKHVVAIAAAWDLPGEWGCDAEALGWQPAEVLRESEKFRQYWVAGKGAGTRRSVKGWRQSWSNWLEKASREKR